MEKRQRQRQTISDTNNLFSSSSSEEAGLSSRNGARANRQNPRVRRVAAAVAVNADPGPGQQQGRRGASFISDFKMKNPLTNVKRVPGPLPKIMAAMLPSPITPEQQLRSVTGTSSDSDQFQLPNEEQEVEEVEADEEAEVENPKSSRNTSSQETHGRMGSLLTSQELFNSSIFVKDSTVVKLPSIHRNPNTTSFAVDVESDDQPSPSCSYSNPKKLSPRNLSEDLEQRRKRAEVLEECFGHYSSNSQSESEATRQLGSYSLQNLSEKKQGKLIRFRNENLILDLDDTEEWKPQTRDSVDTIGESLSGLQNAQGMDSSATSAGTTTTSSVLPATTTATATASDSHRSPPEVESLFVTSTSESGGSSDSEDNKAGINPDTADMSSSPNLNDIRGPSPRHLPKVMAMALAELNHPSPSPSSSGDLTPIDRPDSIQLTKKRISMPQSKVAAPSIPPGESLAAKALKSLQIGTQAFQSKLVKPILEFNEGKKEKEVKLASAPAAAHKKKASFPGMRGQNQEMEVETDPEEPPGIPHYLIRSSLSTSSLDDQTDYSVVDFPHKGTKKEEEKLLSRSRNVVDINVNDDKDDSGTGSSLRTQTWVVENVITPDFDKIPEFMPKVVASLKRISSTSSSVPRLVSSTMFQTDKSTALKPSSSRSLPSRTSGFIKYEEKSEEKAEAEAKAPGPPVSDSVTAAVSNLISTTEKSVPIPAPAVAAARKPFVVVQAQKEKIPSKNPIPIVATRVGSNKSMLNRIPLRNSLSKTADPEKSKSKSSVVGNRYFANNPVPKKIAIASTPSASAAAKPKESVPVAVAVSRKTSPVTVKVANVAPPLEPIPEQREESETKVTQPIADDSDLEFDPSPVKFEKEVTKVPSINKTESSSSRQSPRFMKWNEKAISSKPSIPKVLASKKITPRAVPTPRKSNRETNAALPKKPPKLTFKIPAGTPRGSGSVVVSPSKKKSTGWVVPVARKSILKAPSNSNENYAVSALYFTKTDDMSEQELKKSKVRINLATPTRTLSAKKPIVRSHFTRKQITIQPSVSTTLTDTQKKEKEEVFKATLAQMLTSSKTPAVQSKVDTFRSKKISKPSTAQRYAKRLSVGNVLYPDKLPELRASIAKRRAKMTEQNNVSATKFDDRMTLSDIIEKKPRNRMAEAKRAFMLRDDVNKKSVVKKSSKDLKEKQKDRVLCRKPFKLTLMQLMEAIDQRKKNKGQGQGQTESSNVQLGISKIMDIKTLFKEAQKSGKSSTSRLEMSLSEMLNKDPSLAKAVEAALQSKTSVVQQPQRVSTPRKMGIAIGPKVPPAQPNYLKPVDRNPKNPPVVLPPAPANKSKSKSKPFLAPAPIPAPAANPSQNSKDKDKPGGGGGGSKVMPSYLIFGRFQGLRERIAGKKPSQAQNHHILLPNLNHPTILEITQKQNVK